MYLIHLYFGYPVTQSESISSSIFRFTPLKNYTTILTLSPFFTNRSVVLWGGLKIVEKTTFFTLHEILSVNRSQPQNCYSISHFKNDRDTSECSHKISAAKCILYASILRFLFEHLRKVKCVKTSVLYILRNSR